MKVAMILLALLCAGCCDQRHIVLVDENGCEYIVEAWTQRGETVVNGRSLHPLEDARGKQICRDNP